MNGAFQIIALTDRSQDDGERVVEIYAVIADSADAALTIAKERLPIGWDVSITPAFRYAPAAVQGLEPGELHQMH